MKYGGEVILGDRPVDVRRVVLLHLLILEILKIFNYRIHLQRKYNRELCCSACLLDFRVMI